MRFMIIVKATKESEAGVRPKEEMFAAMAAYHEELAQAGVLLDAYVAALVWGALVLRDARLRDYTRGLAVSVESPK